MSKRAVSECLVDPIRTQRCRGLAESPGGSQIGLVSATALRIRYGSTGEAVASADGAGGTSTHYTRGPRTHQYEYSRPDSPIRCCSATADWPRNRVAHTRTVVRTSHDSYRHRPISHNSSNHLPNRHDLASWQLLATPGNSGTPGTPSTPCHPGTRENDRCPSQNWNRV